jgi:hypothetical protein
MTVQLSDQDRRVVDLLMDRASGAGNGNGHNGDGRAAGMAFSPVGGAFASRIQAVEGMLQLLDHVPVSEPPADLVARTMRRIEEAAQALPGVRPGATAGTTGTRPIA